jgi:TPR repeat protein
MPTLLICCVSLPPATISSVPIYYYANEHEEVADKNTEQYYYCGGKSICAGYHYSSWKSGNKEKCPFCNSDQGNKTIEEHVEEIRRRAEANDPASIFILGDHYCDGLGGLQQDQAKAMELYTRAAELGYNKAHNELAVHYAKGGDLKKAKFHFEAAAMAGHEVARNTLGYMEVTSGNIDQAVKHWTIAASAGHCDAMHQLRILFEKGYVSRESIETTLTDYNNSCAEMRSEARDAYICWRIDHIVAR